MNNTIHRRGLESNSPTYDSPMVITQQEAREMLQPPLRVGTEVTQCIQELSRANEALRQNEEKLRARIAMLESQISKFVSRFWINQPKNS